MSKKRLWIVISVVAAAVVLLVSGGVVYADDGAGTNPPAPTGSVRPLQVLKRLLAVRDEAKLDAALQRLQEAGKITAEQGVRVKTAWEKIHEHPALAKLVMRLARVKDPAKLDEGLKRLQDAGKITEEQAVKIRGLWEKVQTKIKERQAANTAN
jgi:hypothetical protein